MKIVKYLSIAVIASSLVACGSEENAEDIANGIVADIENTVDEAVTSDAGNNDILGDWKCTSMDLEMPEMAMEAATEQEKMMIDQMTTMIEGMKAQMVEHGTMTINGDGTISMKSVNMQGMPETANGEWSLSEDDKYFIVNTGQRNDSLEVKKLTADEFVFGLNDGGTSFTTSWGR